MTISATTQGLRMGVATSTSRPAVPFDGQVISETDTDSLQVYKGSAWAPVSGLTFISATAVSGSSTSVNNCFTSTYTNYRIIFNPTAAVGVNSPMTFRLRASGTDAITNYISQRIYAASAAAGGSLNASGTDEWSFLQTNGATITTHFFVAEIYRPQVASASQFSLFSTGQDNSNVLAFDGVAGVNTNATSYDGFTLITTGTSIAGTVYVYGYSNS